MQHLPPFFRYPDRKGAIAMKDTEKKMEQLRRAWYRDPQDLYFREKLHCGKIF